MTVHFSLVGVISLLAFPRTAGGKLHCLKKNSIARLISQALLRWTSRLSYLSVGAKSKRGAA